MPQAIHESLSFNSRKREVAIHCVFSVKDNTHYRFAFFDKVSGNRTFFQTTKGSRPKRVMSLSEKYKNTTKCEHRIWLVKRRFGLSPDPYYKQKRARVQGENPYILALFVLLMNWCWRIMNWLCHEFSLRSMNWIATNVPQGTIHAAGNSRKHGFQFTQPKGCNSLRVLR